ncbi:hypothetical protein F5051DRAFT_420924 [Lentinula edodes]|nr:hypothetical protein F5051DRAFT_420924 [Lentinula edodes]
MPNPSFLSPLEPARATSSSSRPDSRLSASSTQSSFHGHHSRSSSRASSSAGSLFSSNPDVDTEKVEIDHERERNWNAPRPLWHQHPSSPNHRPSLSFGQHSLSAERVRTLSFPSRPDSRLSISSPRPGHQRQDSYDSLRSSSRASSRASSPRGLLRSLSSIDGDEELLHEQERNWNSPRPHHSRSSSSGLNHPSPSNTLKRTQSLTQKIPSSPSSSTSSSHFTIDTSASARRRAESLKTTRIPSVHSSSPVLRKESLKHRTSLSPFSSMSTKLSAPSSSSRPYDYSSRPHSPLPPIDSNASLEQLNVGHTSVLPSPSFSKPRSTLSPNSLRSPSLSRTVPLPSPSVSQRKSGVRSSHIPVRTSSETKTTGTVLFPESGTAFPVVQELQELPQQIPDAHSELVEDGNNDKANSDSTDTDTEAEESNQLVQENTPTLRSNGALPSIETPDPAETSSAYVSFEGGASLQKIIASPPSPPPSSPSDGPSTPEAEASFSFPSTPPRKEYRTPTKLEFQTPSPPKNLPDLPEPPSDFSDNEDHEYPPPNKGNLSSLKTPKPPGAWTVTPLPPRTHALLRSNSLPTDDENDSGLATPAASLSRAATMPPRTPALPGGWMNTPANRKSVRFHEETLVGKSLNAEIVAPKVEEAVHAAVKSLGSPPNSKVGTTCDDNPQTSPSLAHSPRKATTIRVVDAFGREEKKGTSDSIRIVDAMGQIVVEDSIESGSSIVLGIPPTRQKALEHVRNGLHELVEEMNNDEGLIHITTSEISRERIRKLEQESKEARESRVHLASKLSSNVAHIQKKLAPLRASMQQSTPIATPPSDRRPTGWSWLFWALLQLLIIFAMYRVASSYAKKIFFTTYYDPLYPDLFFYTSSPTNYCSSPSIFETLQSEGWRAAARQVFEYMAIIFSSWQPPCQWQGSYQGSTAIWPPT